MMQHKSFCGMEIAVMKGVSLEDRERESRLEVLQNAASKIKADSPWFALRVMTGRETVVQEGLEILGITSLVPQRKGKTWERRGRKIEGHMMPVIHGYVLVQSVPEPEILVAFKGLDAVIGVLGGAEKPMRVTAQEINRFKAMAEAGAYDWEAPSTLVLSAGDQVQIDGGPFNQFAAVVVTPSTKGKGDVVVTVRILGGEVPMTLPLAMLSKL